MAMSPRNPSAQTFADSSTATPRRSSDIVTRGRILRARSRSVLSFSSSSAYIEMKCAGSETNSAFLRSTSSLPRTSPLGKSE